MGDGIKLPVINGLGRTNRIDNWWSQPLTMGIGLTAAMIYTLWRLFIYTTEGTISYKPRRLYGDVTDLLAERVGVGLVWPFFVGPSDLGQCCGVDSLDSIWIPWNLLLTCAEFTTVPSSRAPLLVGVDEPEINKKTWLSGRKALVHLQQFAPIFPLRSNGNSPHKMVGRDPRHDV